MRRLVVLISMFVSQLALAQTAPKLTVLNRVQTGQAYGGIAELLHDKSGAPLYVIAEQLPDKSLQLEVRDHNNAIVQSMPLAPPPAGDSLRPIRTDLLDNGDIVMTMWVGDPNGNGAHLVSNNITQKRATELSNSGSFPQLMDRLTLNGRTLVLVSIDGPSSSDPETVKVIDEATGAAIAQLTVPSAYSGHLGVDKNGDLKAVIAGSQLFSLIDVKTSTATDLPHTSSQSAGDLELVTGKFMSLTDGKTQQVLKVSDLINNQVKPVMTISQNAQILKHGQFIADGDKTSTTITDVTTGKVIAKVAKGQARVDDFVQTANGVIVVMGEIANPNSYMPGTILTYINAKTGKVLRTMKDGLRQYAAHLNQAGDTVVALEVDRMAGLSQYNVVDVGNDSVITSGHGAILGGPVVSGSGQLVAVEATENGPVCVFNVLDPSLETCVNDPQVSGNALFGYKPLAVRPGRLELPLMGPMNQFSAPVLGFIDLHID